MKYALPLCLVLAACASSRAPVAPGAVAGSPVDQLARIIEAKGCQLGPVRAAEARDEMGIDQATYDALIATLVETNRASVHTDGQVELMSEVCI